MEQGAWSRYEMSVKHRDLRLQTLRLQTLLEEVAKKAAGFLASVRPFRAESSYK
jgi:hypothetical protein